MINPDLATFKLLTKNLCHIVDCLAILVVSRILMYYNNQTKTRNISGREVY